MEVGQIHAFLAVAEELHFGRAAGRLHMAQPALSRTIKQLERDLGTRLFDRSTRSVTLTHSGAALITPARDALDALRRAETIARSAENGEVGIVRVAFAGISTHRIVARSARLIRARRPGIELELSSQNFAQPAMGRLLRYEVDVALGRWDHVPQEAGRKVAMRDRLVLAVPDTDPLAGARKIGAAQLRDVSFVSLPPHEGSVLLDRLGRLARIGAFVPSVVQVAPDTQTALALVSAEVGCHLTLRSVADSVTDPTVAFVDVDEDLPDVHLRVAWRRMDRSPALHAVVAAILERPDEVGVQPSGWSS